MDHRIVENGTTTVEKLEDGRLMSRVVNGEQVAIESGRKKSDKKVALTKK